MRLLHVLEPSEGGVPAYVRDLSRELVGRGHSVDAIVSDRPGPFPASLQSLGAGVARVPLRAELGTVGADVRAAASIARIMARSRWDLVHTHGNKGGLLGRPLARTLGGVPVVHSTHGFDYLTQRRRPRRTTEARRAASLALERALAPSAAVILCASAFDRDNALADGIGRPHQLEVVPNGVEPPARVAVRAELRAIPGTGPVVGFLARLHEGKGPLEFLEAVAAARRGGTELRAAVVGSGPLDREVRARAESLGLRDVPVLAFDGRPFDTLAAFDAYVLPSRWEVFGLTIAEAMAASLPVIASDVGGIPELVGDGENGILFPAGDIAALADAIGRLAREPGLRERMGALGHLRWRESFRLRTMVDSVERIYLRVAAER